MIVEMSGLVALVSFIVALGILITAHEFGHFWVARRCGVKVLKFSIGFGKKLYGWTDKHGTEFVVAAIPLGGYVKMLDSRVEEVPPELQGQAFNHKTIGQRAAIVSAGPIANFLLALLFYWLINMMGQSVLRPVVGSVIPDSVAAHAGILPNEELKSIAGIETKSWYDVTLALVRAEGSAQVPVQLSPLDSGWVRERVLDLSNWKAQPNRNPIADLGIVPVSGDFRLNITSVVPGTAAQEAGFEQGDRVVSVNGRNIESPMGFVKRIQDSPEIALQVKVERKGEMRILTLTPDRQLLEDGRVQGIAGFGLGVEVEPVSDQYIVKLQYGPLDAVYYAGQQTWQMSTLMVKEVGRLVSGNRDLNTLAGPITIAKGAGQSAESGLVSYLGFLAIISLNLGIINLLPLPVLDGGHLLFLALEKITGKPVSEKVQDYSYRIGIILLVMLMGLAFFNDISRP